MFIMTSLPCLHILKGVTSDCLSIGKQRPIQYMAHLLASWGRVRGNIVGTALHCLRVWGFVNLGIRTLLTYDSEDSHSSGSVTRVKNKSFNQTYVFRSKLTLRVEPPTFGRVLTFGKSPESRSATSEPCWWVVVPPATSVCSEKRKSGWQDLFLYNSLLT